MRVVLLILSFAFASFAQGQDDTRKNTIYAEALGNGLVGSVNYERQLTKKPGLNVRLGTGFYYAAYDDGYSSRNKLVVTVPAGVNYLFRLKGDQSFVDAGLGLTWTRNSKEDIYDHNRVEGFVIFIPSVGYRRHTKAGYMYRISFTPLAGFTRTTYDKDDYGFKPMPFVGISFGKRF